MTKGLGRGAKVIAIRKRGCTEKAGHVSIDAFEGTVAFLDDGKKVVVDRDWLIWSFDKLLSVHPMSEFELTAVEPDLSQASPWKRWGDEEPKPSDWYLIVRVDATLRVSPECECYRLALAYYYDGRWKTECLDRIPDDAMWAHVPVVEMS